MREEIVLDTGVKVALAIIRKELLPFTQQTIRMPRSDVSSTVYYLKNPVTQGNTLTVQGISFLIVGDIRQPKPAEEVFRFELTELGELRTRICGECRLEHKALEEIFQKVWGGVIR
jgi:hypothetical protein